MKKQTKPSKSFALFLTLSLMLPMAVPAFAADEAAAQKPEAAVEDQQFEPQQGDAGFDNNVTDPATGDLLDFEPQEGDTEFHSDVVDVAEAEPVLAEVTAVGEVGKFSVPAAYADAYDAAFAVRAASVANNGGKYGSSVVTNVIDGKVNNHWETGKPNTDAFKNHLTFTFAQAETLGSVVYYPRTQGAANKGFPTAFSIYASQTDAGEDFKLVVSGTAKAASGGTQIAFPDTAFKRLRFVFDQAQENWAACGEMKFYRSDPLPAQVEGLFADGTWRALANGVTKASVAALVSGMSNHPLRDSYADALDLAQRLADGETAPGFTVSNVPARGPYGDDIGRAATWNQMFPYQPTGYYAVPGTKLDVYVEPGFADGQTGSLPQLVLGQIAKDKNGWGRRFNLKEGHNVIQVPGVNNMNPGAIYFVNHNYGYTGITPTIRFVDANGGDGVRRFPLFYQDESSAGTGYLDDRRDEAAFMAELEAYIPTLAATDALAAAGNGNYNIAELGSENVLVSTSATGALKGVKQTAVDKRTGEKMTGPSDVMKLHEENYNNMMTYAGYEPLRLGQTAAPNQSDPLYRQYRPIGRFMIRVFCQGPFGWGDAGYIGFNGGFSENNKRGNDMFVAVASPGQIAGAGWGVSHELGHLLEGSRIGRAEYTNNLFSLQAQIEYQVDSRVSARFRNQILNYNNNGYKQAKRPGYINDNFVLLGILYQIEAVYGDHGNAYSPNSVYARALRWSRDNGGRLSGLENGDTLSMNRFLVAASNAIGVDLSNHFEHYGIQVTAAAKAQLTGLAPNEKKTWLATSAADAKNVQTLPQGAVPCLSLTRNAGKAVLSMDVPAAPAGAVQTYEIMRDGQLAGYALAGNASNIPVATPSNKVTWTDGQSADGANHVYTVRAYDARLNVSGDSAAVTMDAAAPYILVDGATLLTIHQAFDPLSVVKAHAADGTDLTASVRVAASDLDVDTKGNHTVTYAVTDGAGHEATLDVVFSVVSSFIYASDVTERSAKVGWGTLQRDRNVSGGSIQLTDNGTAVPFNKGLGVHATSEVVYDLAGTGFTWFESYVGIDRSQMNTGAQAKFQVFVDGEKRYDSGAMQGKTDMGYVAVDLTGASTLRLVTDSMGANSNDHTIWAGARFAVMDSAPSISAKDVAFTSPGQVDLKAILAGVTATDAEDGDMSAAVRYETDYAPGRTGTFEITYTVTDSDGNTAKVTRALAVVNDSVYVSDQGWKSAKVGWGSAQKDKAIDGKALKLATGSGTKTYDKGLGVHAASEIVYDLTGKGFWFFESDVGPSAASANGNTSIAFKVYVDGALAAETGVMRKGAPAQHLSVPLAGASTLKLVVTDGGNGIGNDHANWADARFLTAVDGSAKDALSAAVAEARGLVEAQYTAESWAAMTTALTQAESVLGDALASQEAVAKALSALSGAMAALKPSVQTAELAELVKLVRRVASIENISPENTKHQQDILNNLIAACDDAEAALADQSLTQDKADYWVSLLTYYLWDFNPDYTPGYSPIPLGD